MKNKNIIIAAVGDNSLHRHWLKNAEGFDSFLIYFGDAAGYAGESTYYKIAKGFKFHLIQDLLEQNQWLFDYEYIWLPDDDIYATSIEINYMFSLMKKFNLWIGQPSIMGWYGVDITLHQKGSLLRFTNWVEIMCPCFDSDSLRICKDVFKDNTTGWCIEAVWNKLLGRPQDKIAILDDVVAIHTRPVLKGETYKEKSNALQVALRESQHIFYKWRLYEDIEEDLKAGQSVGGETYNSVVYRQIMRPMETPIPKEQRFWPSCDIFQATINHLRATCESPLPPESFSNPNAKASGSLQRNDSHGKLL